ncbi:DUF4185 domain-containing protein [Dactylosporangium sp. AC04546]|uniref:DUF4185 domain-containing protein n=1 Tax=Dactylosporangium sp. AC04546 TaxID=2862460 RepID=UPI001EDE02B7|nr:DUF4185 domain-containing protein [Dactylosporangium sp. AC04546]WVK78496.1 DUF4185 domain-containing protein [Dactylosporangium sp. AC04546]
MRNDLFVLAGVQDVRRVAQLTGPESANRTERFEVAGQDLGSMFEAYGRTWLVFGDTFGQREPGLTGGGGTEWRSNTLAYTTDRDPSDGLRLDGYVVDDIGWAKELIDSKKVDGVEMTTIPTHGFTANGAMYLAYMSVRRWGEPGEWETNYAGLARSADRGQTWTRLDAPRWPGDSNFIQVATMRLDGEIYFWAVPHGRFGGVCLMKVREQDVEDQRAYRYFAGLGADGEPVWAGDPASARVIVDDTVGELSVVWNPYLSRWLMSYTHGGRASAVVREGLTPWGPWGEAVTLVSQAEVPGLYAPFMAPQYTADGGRTIYFALSVWGPYNVFWYRADLVRSDRN